MKALFAACFILLAGCAHSIHDVYVSDFGNYPKLEQGEMVTARSEQFVVMGFVQETEYVERAKKELLAKCPGEISGISTQFSTSLGFFSWTNKILMQGLCTKAVASNSAVAPSAARTTKRPSARK